MRTEASQSLTFKMVSLNVFTVTIAVVLCLCDVQCQQLQRREQDEWKLTDDIENLPRQRSISDWLNGPRPNGLSARPTFNNGRIGGDIMYKKDNFNIKAYGTVNAGGLLNGNLNPRVGISAGWRFKKRTISLPKEYFTLRIEANPCQFNVYDRNGDGMITLGDLYTFFPSHRLAERLFMDLMTGLDSDVDAIDEEGFNFMAPKLILGCQAQTLDEDNSIDEPGDDDNDN